MNNRTDILNELKELKSQLPQDPLPRAYAVPQGYFDQFASSVLERIKAEAAESQKELEGLSPLLASLSRSMPYSVPEGYFESNSHGLTAVTGEESMPALFGLVDKSGPYTVPVGYFEQFPEQVLSLVEKRSAKVVLMRTSWKRMAVAAALTGLVALSGYFYFNRPSGLSVDDPRWVSQKMKTVDTKTLENFIKTTDIDAASRETARTKAAGSDVDDLLEDVSTSELASFLEQVPTDDEDLMIN